MGSFLEAVSLAREIRHDIRTAKQVREIVSPQDWLAPYFIGDFYYYMFEWWKPQFCDFIDSEYNEIVIGGSLGSGKSAIGELLIARKLYELSCYDNIPALFNLPPTAQLVFMYLSVSQQQSERTGFGRLARLLDSSPYMREFMPRDTDMNSMIKFKNNPSVVGYAGSDVSHFISMDLFMIMLDEANFLRGGSGDLGAFEKAAGIYRESTNRRKGRFTVNDKEYGLSMIVSSSDTENSFTESRIIAGKSNPKFKYVSATILDVKRKAFSDQEFFVMPGLDDFDPFLYSTEYKDQVESFLKLSGVPEEEWWAKPLESFMMDGQEHKDEWDYFFPPECLRESFKTVPINFLSTFKVDIVNSLKEVLGISVRKRMRLYYSKPNWNMCLTEYIQHPFRKYSFIVSTSYSGNEMIEKFIPESFKPKSHALYFVHIDQSIRHDSTGTSLVHLELDSLGRISWVEIDFMLRILPPKDISSEIDIEKIREFYFWLKETFKIKYGLITYDQFQSRESLQHITKRGIPADLLSVDRDDTQYLEFCRLLNKHQIRMYDYPIFRDEFFELKHFLDKRKVDHEGGRSKDLCDSVVGSTWNAIASLGKVQADMDKKDNIAAFLSINTREDPLQKFSFDTRRR